MEAAIVREKLDQAPAILAEHGIDVWLTLVRETLLTRDPSLDLVAGTYCAWQSAFLVSRSGERVAIVGRHDATSVEDLDTYHEVLPYDESIRPGLRGTIERLAPESIALNYSTSDPAADGLTHGLWLVLREALEGTPYVDRVASSAPVVNSLRGRKSASELARIRAAVDETEAIFALVGAELRPGLKETEIAALFDAEVSRRGLGYAWEPSHCPAVNAGPEKDVGHSGPSELTTQRGQLLHCDFGVEKNGYCSDLQRVWYLLDDGESEPPVDVRTAWKAVWAAVDSGAAALRPGALGHEVDAAARARLVSAGFPEPKYALGHQLGRSAHDGGTILGPRWDRYGSAPLGAVEEGNVFTLEYGAPVPGRGYVGLEEDVLVTSDGIEWLSTPQRDLWLVE
jgi:Xaa-Pro aminopeptidase